MFSALSSHHMQLWVSDVEGNKLHELGKTLVEPQVVPPLHRHQVSKPLKTHEKSTLTKKKKCLRV